MNAIAKMMSLLSLDVYNRGYNPGVSSGNEQDKTAHVESEGLGTAAFTNASGDLEGYTILGNFEVIPRLSPIDGVGLNISDEAYAHWKSINFYAQAYRATVDIDGGAANGGINAGTIVIAYRGTDAISLSGDILTDWLRGTGKIIFQLKTADAFYEAVKLKVASEETVYHFF